MGITPRFSNQEMLRELQGGYRKIENGIIRILQRVGEIFVTDARDGMNISTSAFPKGDYQDRTKALRSSVGYFVLKDGEIISYNLQGSSTGTVAARAVLGTIPNKQGYQLVCVAGMYYASQLESKGYNVITSQGEIAIVNVERLLDKFRNKMNKLGAGVDFDMNDIVMNVTR